MNKQYLELSHSQQRFRSIVDREGDTSELNIVLAFTLRGHFDEGRFEKALMAVSEQHDILRSRLERSGDTSRQYISGDPQVEIIRLASSSAPVDLTAIELANAESQHVIKLYQDSLFRALIQPAVQGHAVVLNLHHIIVDGWSLGTFMQDLVLAYNARHGRPSPTNIARGSYADYIEWQQSGENLKRLAVQKRFWVEYLSDSSKPAAPTVVYNGGTVRWCTVVCDTIDEHLTKAVRAAARGLGATVFTTLLGVFFIALSRLTGERDQTVCSLFHNRTLRRFVSTVGPMFNVLCWRIDVARYRTLREVVTKLHEYSARIYINGDVPDQWVADALGREPLYRIGFSFQAFQQGKGIVGLEDTEITPVWTDHRRVRARLDLNFLIVPQTDCLSIRVKHDEAVFSPQQVSALLEGFKSALNGLATAPDTALWNGCAQGRNIFTIPDP